MAIYFDKINRIVYAYKKEEGRATDRELEWLARDTLDRASASQTQQAEKEEKNNARPTVSRALDNIAPDVAAAHTATRTHSFQRRTRCGKVCTRCRGSSRSRRNAGRVR